MHIRNRLKKLEEATHKDKGVYEILVQEGESDEEALDRHYSGKERRNHDRIVLVYTNVPAD